MNSKEWWQSVKADPAKFTDWLQKQHRGEVTAAKRIRALAEKFATTDRQSKTLEIIAYQEEQHARWVAELLENRGIPTLATEGAEERYWAATLPGIKDFATGAAVGAHAEEMRLRRIRAIVADVTAPWDVREAFMRIVEDEEWHERAFRNMATPEALEATKGNHELGEKALSLSH